MISFDEDKLIEYALGLASESDQKIIETEMEASNELRERIANLSDTLAMPALATQAVQPGEKLFSRIEKTIFNGNPFEGFVDRLVVFLDLPEPKVRELLGVITSTGNKWKKSGILGVVTRDFTGGPRHVKSQCSLIQMTPGAILPMHSHVGDEWGFILQGEAKEDNGHVSKPGDIVFQSAQDRHSITATSDDAFVFFTINNGIVFD